MGNGIQVNVTFLFYNLLPEKIRKPKLFRCFRCLDVEREHYLEIGKIFHRLGEKRSSIRTLYVTMS